MAELDKIIKGLEHCMRESDNLYDNPCDGCPYYVEKQPSGICSGELQNDCYDLLKEQPQIVRCKDCKHGEPWSVLIGCGTVKGFGITHNPDWFCADGELAEQNVTK